MEKVDNRRLKNFCVNVHVLTRRQISYGRTKGPFKETYGETFLRLLILFERIAMTEKTLPTETRIGREKR